MDHERPSLQHLSAPSENSMVVDAKSAKDSKASGDDQKAVSLASVAFSTEINASSLQSNLSSNDASSLVSVKSDDDDVVIPQDQDQSVRSAEVIISDTSGQWINRHLYW